MGLFSRKPKISTEDFCRDFYDRFIFAPDIGEVKPWQLLCETDYKFIVEADTAFQKVELALFTTELRILWFEVVGIAWLHHVKDEFAPVQSEFTKYYLQERRVAHQLAVGYSGYRTRLRRSYGPGVSTHRTLTKSLPIHHKKLLSHHQ